MNENISLFKSTAKVKYIPAEKLFIDPDDLIKDNQRHPEERRAKLIELFGPKGTKWSDELAGAISVKLRPNGMYAIKDGGGRWWAVMNLLRQPKKELLCIILEDTGDLSAFITLNSGTAVPHGKLFMARGSDKRNVYEYRICNVLRDNDMTTVPGRGAKTLRVNSVIFAYDLGVLHTAIGLAKKFWGTGSRGSPKSIEGSAIVGLAAVLFIYRKAIDMRRLEKVLSHGGYKKLKDEARKLLPDNKEHQRQWGPAIARAIVARYNLGISKTPRLLTAELAMLQEKVMKHEHYQLFSEVWEMRKIIRDE